MKKQTIITACTFAAMTMATRIKTTVPFQSRRRTNSTDTAAAEKSEAVMDVH